MRRRLERRFVVPASGEPAEVYVEGRVRSPNVVTSPITGEAGALLFLELFEATGFRFEPVGMTVLGDLLAIADEGGAELTLVAHRAHFQSSAIDHAPSPLEHLPPELAAVATRAKGAGPLSYYETWFREGDAVRVRAFIEATSSVVLSGYRDAPAVRYVARDDLGIIEIEEA